MNNNFFLISSLWITLLCFTIPLGLMGQVESVYQTERSVADEIGRNINMQRAGAYVNSPLSVFYDSTDFGQTNVVYHLNDGEYRTYQQPQSSKNFNLYSEGYRSFKSYRVKGSFLYQKTLADSIGWMLGDGYRYQPYYYATIQPGNWNNEAYFLKGSIARRWADKHQLAFKVEYSFSKNARNVDPRPLNESFSKGFGFSYGIKLLQDIWLNLDWFNIQAEEKGSSSYYDDNNDGFGRVKYRTYTMMGTGSFDLERRLSFLDDEQANRFNLALIKEKETYFWLSEWQIYMGDFEFTRNPRSSSNTSQAIGTYKDIRLFSTHTYAYNPTDFIQNTIRLKANYRAITDDNFILGGQNYTFKNTDIAIELSRSNQLKRSFIAINLGAEKQEQNDSNASHYRDFTNLWVMMDANFSPQFITKDRSLTIGLNLYYRNSILDELRVPSHRVNTITNWNYYAMHQFDTANILRGTLQLDKDLTIANTPLTLSLKGSYTSVLNDLEPYPKQKFTPGTNRINYTLSLKFYH